MRIFLLIWFGQVVSLLGSKLTEFALGVWVYQKTGSIAQFAIAVLLIALPNIIVSPFAGALVDRWNRRTAMILSDTVAGLTTIGILLLVSADKLAVWHIYIALAIISTFEAFQVPAYSAAITVLVPKKHFSRANGMVQISKATAKLISPLLAGFLIQIVNIKGILIIDCSTFIVALASLLVVRFPKIKRIKRDSFKFANLWRESIFGWHYISRRPGLYSLMAFMSVVYFSLGVFEIVFWPFILNMGSSSELGLVLSVGGSGMLLGSVLMSTWGGPKRRVYGILYFVPLQGLVVLLGGLNSSLIFSGLAIFGYLFAQPIIISCNQAIWQSKVPAHLQGRVFALQQTIERSLSIIAYILTGPLLDRVLEPAMSENGILAKSIGQFIGVGPGRGMGLLLTIMALINILASVIAYRDSRVRLVEDELPDARESNLTLTKI